MNPSGESNFNSKDAILLGALSYQTYVLFEKGDYILPNGFRHIKTIRAMAGTVQQKEEVFGFMIESQDKIIIAFRGSATSEDLDSDQDIFQVPFPFVKDSGKTHRGVTYIYQSMRKSLLNTLNQLSAKKRLLITGHSLGGAMATLFAYDVSLNTSFKNPVLYSIGSFRVGNPDFVSRFDKNMKKSYRIVNVHDSIPFHFVGRNYPPPFTKDGLYYRHVKNMFPLSYQLDNMTLNHTINCYFKHLSEFNLSYANELCENNPGLCPDTEICRPYNPECGS